MKKPPIPALNSSPAPSGENHTSACRECGATINFTVPPGLGGVFLRGLTPKICEKCTPIAEARWQAEKDEADALAKNQARAERWNEMCPPLYSLTDRSKLPKRALAAIDAWTFGPRGMAFAGKSGAGKTRSMLLLLQRILMETGKSVAYVPSSEFSHRVSRLASDKMSELDAYLGELCKVKVLLLDDIGKGRLTDRVESELYHVIEQRTAHLLPILFTANATGNDLKTMMSADRGEPIIRRLREFCDIVVI